MLSPMRRITLVAVALAISMSSFANSEAIASDGLLDDSDADDRDRDSSRFSIALAGGHFAFSLQTYQDPGAAVIVGTPLWLSGRHASFQFQVGITGLLGLGTDSSNAQLLAGLHLGVTKFWGHLYGVEALIGPAAVAQLGRDSAAAIGLFQTIQLLVRPFDDDRKRISLGFTVFGPSGRRGGDEMDEDVGALLYGLGYQAPF
jgi:hypothetical protein